MLNSICSVDWEAHNIVNSTTLSSNMGIGLYSEDLEGALE